LPVPQLSPEGKHIRFFDNINDRYFIEKYSCPEIITDEPTEEDRASIFQAHCARIEHECQVGNYF
jgi:hypothetical protein